MRVVVALAFVGALGSQASPISRVVELIEGLKSKIQEDGAAEQTVYDKYACWCETTTARKAAAIEDAKVLIEELSKSILELNGRLGTYVAEIAKLEKDVAETTESINAAEERRAKEHEEYIKKKGDLEHALANLNKAIEVLGAGTHGFTPAMVETRMLTVEAGVRQALSSYSAVTEKLTDIGEIKNFLSNPQGALVQSRVNPALGTYAPKSDVIQGILAQMKDDFEKELETSAEEEAAAADAHAKLMETKRADLALLESTLTKTKVNQGEDTKQHAEEKQVREETEAQLKADEKFFDDTKASCRAKAEQWTGRSRARTEEIAAIDEAIGILSSPEATAKFESSATTLLETASQTRREIAPVRTAAYNILKSAAASAHSLRLAAIACSVSATGHFDTVIKDIDVMIENLRKEERADIEHKDWCESEKSAANFKNENLEYDKDQLSKKVERAENKKKELEEEVVKTDQEKADVLASMAAALETRNAENAQFQQALKDDADAVVLIEKALATLSKVYSLVQVDPADSPPDTFQGDYKGKQTQGKGILAILAMIKEDIEKEMKTASEEEHAALLAYEELRADSTATVNALEAKIVSLGQDIASKMAEIAGLNGVLEDKTNSKDATDNYLTDLGPSCDWVDEHFESRMSKRKAEMEGLQKAKAVLAGAGSESTVALVTGKQTVDDELRALDATEESFQKSFGKSFLQRA